MYVFWQSPITYCEAETKARKGVTTTKRRCAFQFHDFKGNEAIEATYQQKLRALENENKS
jgi:hypothetical protein